MITNGTCTFKITGWDEQTYQEIEGGAKLTNAKVKQSYSGDIEGTSTVEYLMSYTVHGTASFVGLERVSGTVAGKVGTFVLQHAGSFLEGKARSSWSIVEGSGTGNLAGLRGSGTYVAALGGAAEVSFAYSFAPGV